MRASGWIDVAELRRRIEVAALREAREAGMDRATCDVRVEDAGGRRIIVVELSTRDPDTSDACRRDDAAGGN